MKTTEVSLVSRALSYRIGRWANLTLTILGLSFVLAATLFPFTFSFKEMHLRDHHPFILPGGDASAVHIVENVLLFLPLGFALAAYLFSKHRVRKPIVLAVILFGSFALSYGVEVLQCFLPSRDPSVIDVLANGLGGVVGFFCYCLVDRKNINLILLGYVALALLISIPLQRAASLRNWDTTFPLLLGNERTGDRQWKGTIFEVYIADRAISEDHVAKTFSEQIPFASLENSLVGAYRLVGVSPYQDKTGYLPDLIWRKNPGVIGQSEGVVLGPQHWLQTVSPPRYLTQRIIESSQFTLGVIVATGDTVQTGPARIVSLSVDPDNRNFTLGQQRSDLVFRLRTPLTGDNGVNPELVVPDVFSTKNPQKLVVTYDGSALLLYVNGVRHSRSLEFTPGARLFASLLTTDVDWLATFDTLYYAIIFVPLAILFSLSIQRLRVRIAVQILLVTGGILLFSLILEGVLVSVSGRATNYQNVLLSMTFGGSGGLLGLLSGLPRREVSRFLRY